MHTISQSIIESLGATLLHSLWQGLTVVLVLSFLLKVLQHKSPQFKYHLSCASLLGLVTWMSSTFFGHFNHNIYQYSDVQIPVNVAPSGVLTGNITEALNWQQNLETYFTSFIELYASELVFIWFLGVLLFGIKWTGAFYYTFSLKKNNTTVVPLKWQNKVKQLSYDLGIDKKINILESAKVDVPMVIGYLKPVILIPTSAFTGFTADQLEAVIVHELAHIKNNDFLINMILSALEVVLFYHPAYWFIYRIIMQERENHCDDIAVAHIGNPRLYAETLFNMEKIRQQHSLAMALQGNKNQLLERIKRVCIAPNQQYKGGINKSGMAMGFLFILAIISLAKVPLDAKENILIPLKEEITEAFIPSTEILTEKRIVLENEKPPISLEETIIHPYSNILEPEGNNMAASDAIYPLSDLSITSVPLQPTILTLPKKEKIQLQSLGSISQPIQMDSIPDEDDDRLTIVSKLDKKGNTTLTYYKKGKVTKRIFIESNKANFRLNGVKQKKGNRTYQLKKGDEFSIKGTMQISVEDNQDSSVGNDIIHLKGENHHTIFQENNYGDNLMSNNPNINISKNKNGSYTIEERNENGKIISSRTFSDSDEAMEMYESELRVIEGGAEHERHMKNHERNMKRHEENMKKHEEIMKEHEENHERNMQKHEENMRKHEENMRKHEEQMVEHEIMMERHEVEREHMEEFKQILIDELFKDGLIKNKKKVDFSLSKGKMKIKGKRVHDKYHTKYLKLYEQFSGCKMEKDSTYRYKCSS